MNNDLKIQYIVARYNNILCHFRLINYSAEWAKVRKIDYCPVCNKKLNEGEDFYLTINNNKLFPNSLIHEKCIEQIDTVGLKFMNFREITKVVYENYIRCKELQAEYYKLHRPWRH